MSCLLVDMVVNYTILNTEADPKPYSDFAFIEVCGCGVSAMTPTIPYRKSTHIITILNTEVSNG